MFLNIQAAFSWSAGLRVWVQQALYQAFITLYSEGFSGNCKKRDVMSRSLGSTNSLQATMATLG